MKPDKKPETFKMSDYGYFNKHGKFVFYQGWKAAYKKVLADGLANGSDVARRQLARMSWSPFDCDIS